MLNIRHANQRGRSQHGWLDSRHSFSFADYYDPMQMGVGPLRVINEDRVAPGHGFHEHGHADMEILSWVLDGALAHKDSIGTGSVIRPGELQRMSAGTGIYHSEFNDSAQAPVHFLQIWILPEQRSLTPGYEQRSYADALDGGWRLIASRLGRDGSVTVHQEVDLYAARLATGQRLEYRPLSGRQLWLQLARGEVRLNGELLQQGDGVEIRGETLLELEAGAPAEVLLFDMAPPHRQ